MSIYEISVLLVVGLMAGIVSGIMGVGGAIIMVPAMVFFLGMTQHNAQGTSLAVLLFPVGVFAVLNYYKRGFVNFKFAFVLIIAFVIGSYFGSALAVNIPDKILKKIFAVLLLFVGARMFFAK
jgi:uncharacterized membrane protein YfcA